MSNKEYTAHWFGLDHHIPTKSKDVAIEVEFEQFYQGLLKNLTHIPDNQLTSLKTRDRLLLCTKNSHFSYSGDIYTQSDGVAMSSPFGRVLAGIYGWIRKNNMANFERTYESMEKVVDETISYIKEETIEHVLNQMVAMIT